MLLTIPLHRALRLSGIPVRVHLDGADVTASCVAADNRYGYAVFMRRNAEGKRFAVWHQGVRTVAMELRTGDVRFATPTVDLPTRWRAVDWFTFPRASRS